MSGPAPAGDVAATARSMWETRPTRCEGDRRLAGVAGAVARRYAVDPTLVRVAFVVLGFTGGGLLLYLAGWVVLPTDPDDAPRGAWHHGWHGAGHGGSAGPTTDRGPQQGRAPGRRGGPPTLLIVVAVVVALLTLGPALAGRVQTVVGLLVGAVLLYGLHTSRAALGVPGSPSAPRGVADHPDHADRATAGAPGGDTGAAASRPPAWDPLGAAPFAWDLPEPGVPTPPRRRRVLTPVTLALALLTAGAVAVPALLGVPGLGVTEVLASALAVVGLGLLVGAFRHTGRGLLAAAVPLVVLTVLSTGSPDRDVVPGWWSDDDTTPGVSRGVDDLGAVPSSAAAVAPSYRTGLGDVDLDLRRVTATPGGPVRTAVRTGAGDVSVAVPADATVTITCHSGIGDVDCLGRTDEVTGLLDPGPPGGPVLDLTVETGAGDVEVQR